MTTVLVDTDTFEMWTDSLMEFGGTPSRVDKLCWVHTGHQGGPLSLVAGAGVYEDLRLLLHWIQERRDLSARPTFNEDFQALELRDDGTLWAYESKCVPIPLLYGRYHAIGSGRCYVLGALAMQASCEEAMRVACALDLGTGFPLAHASLHNLEHVIFVEK